MRINSAQKLIVFDTCHDSRLLKEWEEGLDSNYTKEALVNMLQQIVAAFPDYIFKMSGEAWPIRLANILIKHNSLLKQQLVEPLAKIFAHPDNREVLLRIMSTGEKVLWQSIMRDFYASSHKADALLGTSVLMDEKSPHSFWKSPNATPIGKMCWFHSILCGPWTVRRYFYLPPFSRKMLAPLFNDPAADFRNKEKAEKDDKKALLMFDGEADTITILPVIFNLYMQGNLEPGRYRLPTTHVNRAARTLKLGEFLPESAVKTDRNLRAMMLLNTCALALRNMVSVQTADFGQPHDMVRKIVDRMERHPGVFDGVTLFFLDKSTQRLYEECATASLIHSVLEVLKQTAAGDRIEFTTLLSRLYVHPDTRNILTLLSPRGMNDNSVRNQRSNAIISPSTAVTEAGIPGVLTVVGMLASIGILALEYHPAGEDDPSALWGLVSMRITQLGAYALRITKEYQAPEAMTPEVLFELDSERLLIRALGDTNPYEGMLMEFGTDVGARRYLVTAGQMLAGCNSTGDVERKIANFRRLVAAEPPRVWEEFFETLLARSSCFDTDTESYAIYNVAKDAHDLHDLLATDPELSRMAIRAEGYRILVPLEMRSSFKERLRKAGYLL